MPSEIEKAVSQISRRRALRQIGGGLGCMALGTLLGQEKNSLHHPPAAKRVIYLFQSGGPSQLDLFDHKPALKKFHGKDIFAQVEQTGRLTGFTSGHKIHPIINTRYQFQQHGESGSWTSELLPHLRQDRG